jgi:hypothetical protein
VSEPLDWPLAAWTGHPHRSWYRRCDMCRRRRPFGWLYECYPPADSGFGWWYACPTCLYHTDAWLADLGRELEAQSV